jgi:hypothetical protein
MLPLSYLIPSRNYFWTQNNACPINSPANEEVSAVSDTTPNDRIEPFFPQFIKTVWLLSKTKQLNLSRFTKNSLENSN